MITIDHTNSLVSVTVLGEFTLADFKEFEELVLSKVKFDGPVDLLFDLREMADFTVDMAWEEIKFSRQHGERLQTASPSSPTASGWPGAPGWSSCSCPPTCGSSTTRTMPAAWLAEAACV